MTNTGQALLTAAFQDIGLLAPGDTLGADDAAVGLNDLQQFIDSLGAKALMMHRHTRTVLPLVSGQQNYTIGVGGNLNTARPTWIDEAKCQQTSGSTTLETPVTILTEKQYADIGVKAITTAIVTAIFYDYGWTAGLANVFTYPYPNVAGLSLVLYGPVAVATFTDLASPYTAPPGYMEMLEYNTAIRLKVKYPKGQVDPLLMKLARDSANAIMTANVRPEVLQLERMLTRQQGLGNSYQGVIGGLT